MEAYPELVALYINLAILQLPQANSAKQHLMSLYLLGGTASVLGVAFSFLIGRGITKPIAHVVNVLDRVAARDFTGRVKVQTKDEVGRMGDALNHVLNQVASALGICSLSSSARNSGTPGSICSSGVRF